MRLSGSALFRDAALLNMGRKTPFRITLMISEQCPLRCTTCRIWEIAEPRTPSLEDLERFLGRNPGFSWINLTGGEIFMRSDMADLFRVISRTQRRLEFLNFPTSGQGGKRIAADVEAGLGSGLKRMMITVSFDGGRESHDRLRGSKGSFDRAAETFKDLKRMSLSSKGRLGVIPGLTLSAELIEKTRTPLEDAALDLGLDGIHEIHVNVAHRSSHYYRNSSLGAPAKSVPGELFGRARTSRRNFSFIDLMEKVYLGCAAEYLATHRSPLPCKALSASVFVDAGLDVYPCTVFNRRLGNLRDASFDLSRLRAGPEWKAALKEIVSNSCPGCWTPCEAYQTILGNLFKPSLFKIMRRAFVKKEASQ